MGATGLYLCGNVGQRELFVLLSLQNRLERVIDHTLQENFTEEMINKCLLNLTSKSSTAVESRILCFIIINTILLFLINSRKYNAGCEWN